MTIEIDGPLLSYKNVYFYGTNGENYRPAKLKTSYGFITRQTADEIEFDALTAAEYRQHAARSAEGLHPLRFTVKPYRAAMLVRLRQRAVAPMANRTSNDDCRKNS